MNENVIAIELSTCKHICVFNTVPVHNYYTHNIGYVIKIKLKQTNAERWYSFCYSINKQGDFDALLFTA